MQTSAATTGQVLFPKNFFATWTRFILEIEKQKKKLKVNTQLSEYENSTNVFFFAPAIHLVDKQKKNLSNQ